MVNEKILAFLNAKAKDYELKKAWKLDCVNQCMDIEETDLEEFKKYFPNAKQGFYCFEAMVDGVYVKASITTTEDGAKATILDWNDKYVSRIWDKLQNMTIGTSVYSICLNGSYVLSVRKYQSSFDLSIMQGKKLIDYQDGLELKYNIVNECVTDIIDRNLDLFL